jgi:hypothetical protein
VCVIRAPVSCLGNAGFQAGQECYGDASLWRSHHVLVGICIFGWRQTTPNHSGAEKLRLLPSLSHSAYSGIRHSRHTFGSLLIRDGASLAYVKDQMGHSSIQVTVDTYGHLIPGADIAWADRLDVKNNSAAKCNSRATCS